MKNIINFCLIIFISLIVSCNNENDSSTNSLIYNYPNLLDISGIPQSPKQYNNYCFSDKGSWFGFGLNTNNDTSVFGAFSGPFLMNIDNGRWLSMNLIKLNIYDNEREKNVLFNNKQISNNYFPGLLKQNAENNHFSVKMDLWFPKSNIAINRIKIQNITNKEKQITLNYLVNYFKDFNISSQLKVSSLSLLLNKNDKLNIHFPPHFKISRDRISKNQTNINIDSVFLLQPNDIVETYIIYELNSDNKDQHNYISEVSKSIDECFNKNLKNWNKKISDVVSVNGKFSEKPFQQLSVKALITLTNNWRSVYKDLHHNGLFPSYSYEWFYGFWSWDSWKHAVALAKFDTKLAKEQVLAMFDYQDTLGMIPDVIYPDAIENNWRDTKPPLASWAVYNIFQASNDSNFVNLMLPKLLKYHYWWYKYRDHDNNGLCEYGSTDGTRIAASWESGMDNAVRFDDAIMLKNSENAYSLNQESVDLNSYLYAEKCYLKKMAKIVDNDSLIILLENEAKKLKDKINNTFWDKNSGYYYDVKINDKTKIMAQGPEGWIPLWARIANKEQAELVKTNILDSAKFNTKCPFPTLSKKNKKFDPQNGYWRGPVWFDQAYFAVKGLNNYGYHKIARDITLKLFNNADGLVNSNKAIRENYHPITGEGLNANNFSWTAAHILMFMDINDTIILENKQ